jgi:hypothetical protein
MSINQTHSKESGLSIQTTFRAADAPDPAVSTRDAGQAINDLIEDGVHFRDMLMLLSEVGGVTIIHPDRDTWHVIVTPTGLGLGTVSSFATAFRVAIEHIVNRGK